MCRFFIGEVYVGVFGKYRSTLLSVLYMVVDVVRNCSAWFVLVNVGFVERSEF